MSFKWLILFISVVATLMAACTASHLNCYNNIASKADNTTADLPYTSFVFLASRIVYSPDKCEETEQFPNSDACMIRIENYEASGAFIGRSTLTSSVAYVLTANHFCDHGRNFKANVNGSVSHEFDVVDFNGDNHPADILFSSSTFDACILIVGNVKPGIQMAPVAKDAPSIGQRIYAMSAPKSTFYPGMVPIFEGFFSGMSRRGVLLTIPATAGSSGSAVFNSEGEIVSMIWAKPIDDKESEDALMESLTFGLRFADILKMMHVLKMLDSEMSKNGIGMRTSK
jgi:S1-C subfamily serine protease